MEEFDVNVVLTKISGTQFLGYPGRGFRDVHSEYMDEDKASDSSDGGGMGV